MIYINKMRAVFISIACCIKRKMFFFWPTVKRAGITFIAAHAYLDREHSVILINSTDDDDECAMWRSQCVDSNRNRRSPRAIFRLNCVLTVSNSDSDSLFIEICPCVTSKHDWRSSIYLSVNSNLIQSWMRCIRFSLTKLMNGKRGYYSKESQTLSNRKFVGLLFFHIN